MANLHTPERMPGENRKQYIERRKISKTQAAITRGVHGAGGKTSREIQRDAKRRNGTLRGTFGLSLIASWSRARSDEIADKHRRDASDHTALRDMHGGFTLVGCGHEFHPQRYLTSAGFYRRIWLAGISARRGF